jgi:hypothetical protein
MKKAAEYSKMCDANVYVGIRLRETGQVFILLADASGFWAFLCSQLVCFNYVSDEKTADLSRTPTI